MRTLVTALLALITLAACQTWGPDWSEVTGDRYHHTALNTSSTSIYEIDGKSAHRIGMGRPYLIDPGRRVLLLTAVPLNPAWSAGMRLVEFELDVKPCTRYYIAAKFDNPLGPNFTPFIDEVEPVEYCTPAPPAK